MLRTMSLIGLMACSLAAPAAAQRETRPREIAPREFLVNVTQAPSRFGAPGDHFLTFPTRVEVPGASLVAGTYLFRSVGPAVLRVMSPDGSQVYAMFLTLRTDGDGDTRRERIKFQ